MAKKLIFLDGDGTLWYPTSTKRTEKPHWIYHHPETKDNYLEHMTLAPKLKETLSSLTQQGFQLVLISANPAPPEVAEPELFEKLEYFGLNQFFRSYHSSPGDDPMGKLSIILDVLSETNTAKEEALMIGDSYFYDYEAMRKNGIDAYWIRNEAAKQPEEFPDNLQAINEVYEIVNFL